MFVFRKVFLRALILFSAVPLNISYRYVANCVPGGVVQSLQQTQGKIGLYVLALQTIMPTLYGNLMLMTEGPTTECQDAANLVNSNQIFPEHILQHYPKMSQLGAIKGLQEANISKSYLYVFKNKAYTEYAIIADCVPGPIVGGLDQTGGRVALYTMALKTILPGLFGDLLYIGEGKNPGCIEMMNAINMGNKTIVTTDKKTAPKSFGMREMGVLQGLKQADNEQSYIYVFKNKMWNSTWQVMIPDLKHYGIHNN
eukprot:TRINITY_DN3027_c0_g1_i2.p1 TRINITY_DN3027_c0_g1~~TRINITY_DN3027_c0_g1_i2.p1  ORF type:complete len:255 (-),score=33.64 TRINITY_DN3027_c0_g1_i2:35-799(-)